LARNIPAGIPPETEEAALESLGGAVSLVGQLPGSLRSMLLDIALGSFIQGLQFTVIIGAAVAAALVFVTLRNVQMDSKQN
jgi:DHA2 family multidrug resistance protein-like MFS transporter